MRIAALSSQYQYLSSQHLICNMAINWRRRLAKLNVKWRGNESANGG